jgi:hypothetical protein
MPFDIEVYLYMIIYTMFCFRYTDHWSHLVQRLYVQNFIIVVNDRR